MPKSPVRKNAGSAGPRRRRAVASTNAPRLFSVFGLGVHEVSFSQTLAFVAECIRERRPVRIITANLNYAMLCREMPALRAVTASAGLVLADGMPLLWAAKRQGARCERVAGADLMPALCELAAREGWRVYLLGADPETLARATSRLVECYPGLAIVGGACPRFPDTPAKERAVAEKVKRARPDLLFLAASQPQGDLWLARHVPAMQVPVSMNVGATFKYLAGSQPRAPRVWQAAGLEWLFRLLLEPVRLGPRYVRNSLFLFSSFCPRLHSVRRRNSQ